MEEAHLYVTDNSLLANYFRYTLYITKRSGEFSVGNLIGVLECLTDSKTDRGTKFESQHWSAMKLLLKDAVKQ